MNPPRIRVELNKGKRGVPISELSDVARETEKFLISLSVDIGDADSQWIADNFANGSVIFDVCKKQEPRVPTETWRRALHSVMANDRSDADLNLRIRPETRLRYFAIAKVIPADERIVFGVYANGEPEPIEFYPLDQSSIRNAGIEPSPKLKSFGGIQGVVHAFYKETKNPKLVVRELSTQNLVNCFFTEEMYPHAVALLEDKDGVVFVEGEVSESAEGDIADIIVNDFQPAPVFNEKEFEAMIGAFPNALTGGKDAAELLDDFRE